MPYTLQPAGNVMAIAECEYGTAQSIMFTRFTSCIGILAKVQNQDRVIGIHLVLVDNNSNTFGAGDVPTVTGVLAGQNYDPATVMIIGRISYWQESANAAYTALTNALHPVETYQLGDGVYGADINAQHEIELTYA